LALTDFFTGSPFVVELEKDLSLKQQFLESEGIIMPYTWEDFRRDYTREHLDQFLDLLTADEILRRFSAEARLQGLPAEARLQGLPAEEIKAYLEKLEKTQRSPAAG
jgi:hypothetical protein